MLLVFGHPQYTFLEHPVETIKAANNTINNVFIIRFIFVKSKIN